MPHVVMAPADPRETKELPLGACVCPGAPHVAGDVATVRIEAGWAELRSAFHAGQIIREDGSGYYDEALGDVTAIVRFTTAWNLVRLDEKGKSQPRPINVREVSLLGEETFLALRAHTEALLNGRGRLPNGSGAPSVASSPVSASQSRRSTRQ
jgi:hypothetical protein